jgi:protein-L-isoaspartate(D-aspartate) O-methyltransferase
MAQSGAAERRDPVQNDDPMAQARRNMVDSQLRPSDVFDPRVFRAMGRVPRENFVPEDRQAVAYVDRAVPLGDGRYLNAPLSTGLLLDRARVEPGDNALVIGCGRGYVAAVLSGLCASVVALEDGALAGEAASALQSYANVKAVSGPLQAGWSAKAPYTLIVVDGAIEELPATIVEQLADGGRLMTGVIEKGVTRLSRGVKSPSAFGLVDFIDSDIAPLPGFSKAREFQF